MIQVCKLLHQQGSQTSSGAQTACVLGPEAGHVSQHMCKESVMQSHKLPIAAKPQHQHVAQITNRVWPFNPASAAAAIADVNLLTTEQARKESKHKACILAGVELSWCCRLHYLVW